MEKKGMMDKTKEIGLDKDGSARKQKQEKKRE
jgi:hypothetical protein